MRVTRQFSFEAAHRLPDHDGKCKRLHGHHYVVEVTVTGEVQGIGAQTGMVLDFSRIDAALVSLFDSWDHRTILWTDDPLANVLLAAHPESIVLMDAVPTAEHLAEFIGGVANFYFRARGEGHMVDQVVVRETPKGWATWTP